MTEIYRRFGGTYYPYVQTCCLILQFHLPQTAWQQIPPTLTYIIPSYTASSITIRLSSIP